MSSAALLGLSMLISIGGAGVGWLAATVLERASGDVALRDRAWSVAFYLPTLPPLAMGLYLLAPAPTRPVLTVVGSSTIGVQAPVEVAGIAPAAASLRIDGDQLALAVLAAALLLALVRLAVLGWRTRRLGRVLARTAPATGPIVEAVARSARGLGVAAPEVRVLATATEAMLAGLVRPVLILPSSLVEATDDPAAGAVIAHELAHLKRGDHRAIWFEEAFLALLAFNPILPLVRARLAAAREEACDALALHGAATEARHAYARSLLEAFRSRADLSPALTFTGNSRNQAMRRLHSILTPPSAASTKTRLAALGMGVALLALTGMGTGAVASQRQASSAPVPDNGERLTANVAVMAADPAAASLPPMPQTRDHASSAASRTADLGGSTKVMINGVPLAAGFPYWALAADRVDIQTAEASGGASLDFILSVTDSPPVYVNGAPLPDGVGVAAIKSELVERTDRQADGSIQVQLKPRAPSAARSAASSAAKTRLTVEISPDKRPLVLASGDVLKVSLLPEGDGEVPSMTMDAPVATDGRLPNLVFLDLDDRYFPSRMPGRAYELRAEVQGANGRTLYASEPTTLRLAPWSQGRLERMRPELVLRPVS